MREFPLFFKGHWHLCMVPNSRQMLAVRPVQGDCEIVLVISQHSCRGSAADSATASLLAPRLLHSLSLVAEGLLVGYETWPPIGWHHPFVISCSVWDCLVLQWIMGSHDQWKFPLFFTSYLQSPCRLWKSLLAPCHLLARCQDGTLTADSHRHSQNASLHQGSVEHKLPSWW